LISVAGIFKSGIRKMLNYQPLADFVLIERIEENNDMQGGILLPEIGQQKSNKGRVVAVGEGRIVGDRIIALPLSTGDTVLFSKYGAEEVKLDGVDYLLLRYDEIKLKQRLVIS
jgi:chaperonin GroES